LKKTINDDLRSYELKEWFSDRVKRCLSVI